MRCPFAIWHPIGSSAGKYTGGPFKIVHHTTEGSSAAGAFDALRVAHAESHFVVDPMSIYQLLDTDKAARALRNAAGGVQTNLDSAVQIEMVGYAGRPKDRATLSNVRRLCRWIEQVHSVPPVWPNGYPNPPTPQGRDPGHHNRNAANWDTKGGHYGHSQVPENTHWDPAYTKEEVDFLMAGEAEQPPVVPAMPELPAITRVRVSGLPTGDHLNLRNTPGVGTIIGSLPEGLLLDKLGAIGHWYQVRTPYMAIVGWAYSGYLKDV